MLGDAELLRAHADDTAALNAGDSLDADGVLYLIDDAIVKATAVRHRSDARRS